MLALFSRLYGRLDLFQLIQQGLRIYPLTVSVPQRTVPYRFLRGTVQVDRTAYRTFLTVFRDFYLKARTLPRFKQSRFTVLTLISRLSANRTVPTHLPFFVILTLKILFWWSLLEKREPYRDEFLHEKSLKIDIYAERFALTALFSCKK